MSPSHGQSFTWSSLLDTREHSHKTNPLGQPPFLIFSYTAQLILNVGAKDPLLYTVQQVLIMFMCCDYKSRASSGLLMKHYCVLYDCSALMRKKERTFY